MIARRAIDGREVLRGMTRRSDPARARSLLRVRYCVVRLMRVAL